MYSIEYLGSVLVDDLPKISSPDKIRIKKSIEQKLQTNPIKFGKPLRYSLRGCRSLRVGDYRVIYKIESNVVLIIKIGHRREVYED